MKLDSIVSRRELCGLGASALVMAGLSSCASGGPHDGTSAEASPEAEALPATGQHVRLIGRTCRTDGITWLPQSGSGIEFAVIGTKMSIDLAADDNASNEKDLCPRFAILVDGKVVLDDTLSEPTRTVEVFGAGKAKSAVVGVVHLSEASRGAVGVRDIVVESNDPNPVTPTLPKDLCIEFVGDSITCAYGVESSSFDEAFATTTENFMKSYAFLAAQALDAEYSAVCYSGYGVVSGWSADGTKNADMLVPLLYDVVALGHEQPWDFSEHAYDVVVINLGTNDYTYTGTDEGRMAEFAHGYADLLATIRELNPNSYLVCTLGTMGALELFPSIEAAVEHHRARTGDARITCYATKPLDEDSDDCGTRGHPREGIQRRDANTLVGVLRRELGLST